MKMTQNDDALDWLLPEPRHVQPLDGLCDLQHGIVARITEPDPRICSKWQRMLDQRRDRKGAYAAHEPIVVTIATDPNQVPHLQGYRLSILPDAIHIIGGGAAGCFYGLQTLRQIMQRVYHRPPFKGGPQGGLVLPACVIDDEPDFTTRGLLYDVTRGKVPTLQTLMTLADRLSTLKINQLQLYIEHAFTFAFDPDICDAEHGMTGDEIRTLAEYCQQRFIDLVPAVATLGHMGRILSMPRYRHLAAIEPTKSWGQMSWHERARGLTIDVYNDESMHLVEQMWRDVLDAFSGPQVNICGDEPHDLWAKSPECGGNEAPSGAGGLNDTRQMQAYLRRVRDTRRVCVDRGRQVAMFSDVLTKHPGMISQLPSDVTLLHWGYDDTADYDVTARFVDAGFDTIVCPGTSGWKRILPAMGLAERNISSFARAGKRYGAIGLLNTDWGDHGHFNLLSCSLHGIALGAACGWRADHPTGSTFDRRFTRTVLDPVNHRLNTRGTGFCGTGLCGTGFQPVIRCGTSTTKTCTTMVVETLRRASHIAERCETWTMLRRPLDELRRQIDLPDVAAIEQALVASQQAVEQCHNMRQLNTDNTDADELAVACQFAELCVEKLGWVNRRVSQDQANLWADRLQAICPTYEKCWLNRNKTSGLADIHKALIAAAVDARAATTV